MAETVTLTNGTTRIQCSEETAQRLPAVWKPVKGARARGRGAAPAARAPKKSTKQAPAKQAPAPSTEPVTDPPTDLVSDPVDPVTEPPAPPAAVAGDGPDAGWTIGQLRDFAEKHEINLGKAKKHGEILAVIDDALADDEDDENDEDLDGADVEESEDEDDDDDDESDDAEDE